MIRSEYLRLLLKQEKVVFAFFGELGWELIRFCGYVRWFKKTYPEKNVIVVTRKERSDLYYGAVDGIMTITINGDYNIYRPNMYRLDFFPDEKYQMIIDKIRKEFPHHKLIEPPKGNKRNIFPFDKMDFNFTPHSANKKLADIFIEKNKDKIPVVLCPRKRMDLRSVDIDRNWPDEYWYDLFNLFSKSEKYIVFIAGISPTIVHPPRNPNFIVLEKYVETLNDLSDIGLTIEIMRRTKVTIGSQSSLPILSNLLGTPTILWGHENIRHRVKENPFKTKCTFLDDLDYKTTTPKKVFEILEEKKWLK